MTERDDDLHHRGLGFDVATLIDRRRALGLLAGAAGALILAGCGSNAAATSTTSSTSTSTRRPDQPPGPPGGPGEMGGAPSAEVTEPGTIPSETAGPYPGDGSNGVTQENYLRGVQETDANGNVKFASIFPACYSGRWPHIHFEVYQDLATATSSGPIKKTSQMALPQEICQAVYATDGYSASVRNLSQVSLSTDNVFSDDKAVSQLGTVSGSVADGYVASLNVQV